MPSRKRMIILAIIILVILGLAIAIYLNYKSSPINNQVNLNQNTVQVNVNAHDKPAEIPKVVDNPNPVSQYNSVESSVVSIARNFAERYASFSSDSHFSNLQELKILSTPQMSSRLEQIIRTTPTSTAFYGVTAKVLKIDIDSLNDTSGVAKVTANLQKQETKGNQQPTVSYQNMSLDLVKSGNTWLVDQVK